MSNCTCQGTASDNFSRYGTVHILFLLINCLCMVAAIKYASETLAWQKGHQSRIHVVEVSYLKGDLIKVNVYGKFSMPFKCEGINHEVTWIIKYSTLKWCVHLQRWKMN